MDARDHIRRAADLARLSFGEEEGARLAGDLARILAAFETLSAVDVEGVEEMTGPLAGDAPPSRPDEVADGTARAALLDRAPEPLDDAFFGVPRTVGGEG